MARSSLQRLFGNGALPTQFSKADARWVTPLPAPAGSTPVVSGDRIFLTTPDSSKNLNLLCLDAKRGRFFGREPLRWGQGQGRNNMAAPSRSRDGKRVIAMFGTGDVAALILREGSFGSGRCTYGRFAIMWIYGSSPLLDEGQLIIPVLQRDEMPSDYPLFDGKPERESTCSLDPPRGARWKVAGDRFDQGES